MMNHSHAMTILVTLCLLAPNPGRADAESSRPFRLDQVTIPASELNGIRIDELSGLAWDKDENLLYAISDKGSVVHIRLAFQGAALVAAEPVRAAALTDPDGKGSSRKRFNAEGLTVQNADNGRRGDTVLIVSLEGGDQPTIMRFSPAGVALGGIAVPAPLDDTRNYRKKKQGLESVALHPGFGLLTAPESPLAAVPDDLHVIYANGRHWSFGKYAAGSRLKGIDVRADGSLLVLERSRLDSGESMTPTLRRVDIMSRPDGGMCVAEDLAVLPGGLNNFEGMTHLDDGRVLIVSDQGEKDRENTTLVMLTFPGV